MQPHTTAYKSADYKVKCGLGQKIFYQNTSACFYITGDIIPTLIFTTPYRKIHLACVAKSVASFKFILFFFFAFTPHFSAQTTLSHAYCSHTFLITVSLNPLRFSLGQNVVDQTDSLVIPSVGRSCSVKSLSSSGLPVLECTVQTSKQLIYCIVRT